jgi:hypothetical protein
MRRERLGDPAPSMRPWPSSPTGSGASPRAWPPRDVAGSHDRAAALQGHGVTPAAVMLADAPRYPPRATLQPGARPRRPHSPGDAAMDGPDPDRLGEPGKRQTG